MKNEHKRYIILSLILAAFLFLYLFTMPPVFKNNDSPETITAAYTLGIGHPPAYPLFTMAAKAFTLLPFATPGFRVNLFASFLALLGLLLAFYTAVQINRRLSGADNENEAYVSVIILGLSCIFWNQAIEAKGGIYILNLLFLQLLILLSVLSFYTYRIKYFYLAAFILGLSLSNHWPSMIIVTPLFAYFIFKYRLKFKLSNIVLMGALFILGLTPYIYLPVRSLAFPDFNMGYPGNLENFLWVVLRKGYNVPVEPSLALYIYQIKRFLLVFFTNYLFFIAVAAAGAYYVYKKDKKLFFLPLGIFIIVVLMVAGYNRTKEGVIWLMDIFLMPAQYAVFLMLAPGMVFIKEKITGKPRLAVNALIVILLAALGLFALRQNNAGRDYLSYDYGNDILKTMPQGAVYIGEGDYNLMPLYYIQNVQKRRLDVKFISAPFLIFKWGIEDYYRKYDNARSAPMKSFEVRKNLENLIASKLAAAEIYRSSHFPAFDGAALPYAQTQKGILVKISGSGGYEAPAVYDLYNYRGIYNESSYKNKTNIDLVTWYPVSMVSQAGALVSSGRAAQAIELYKKSLLFPAEKPENGIYFNMALAYSSLGERENEVEALINSVQKSDAFCPALERLGALYFEDGLFIEAGSLMSTAVRKGCNTQRISQIAYAVKDIKPQAEYEYVLEKANGLMGKNEAKRALRLYNFLLEKNFKSSIINLNKGVYYFATKDYINAKECFEKSKNETKSQQAYLYLAYACFKMEQKSEALRVLEEGLAEFRNDKDLNALYSRIKQEKASDKDTDRNGKQR